LAAAAVGCAVADGAAAASPSAAAAATITTPVPALTAGLLLSQLPVRMSFVRMEGFPSLGYAFTGSC
jgi:hypothetical protein